MNPRQRRQCQQLSRMYRPMCRLKLRWYPAHQMWPAAGSKQEVEWTSRPAAIVVIARHCNAIVLIELRMTVFLPGEATIPLTAGYPVLQIVSFHICKSTSSLLISVNFQYFLQINWVLLKPWYPVELFVHAIQAPLASSAIIFCLKSLFQMKEQQALEDQLHPRVTLHRTPLSLLCQRCRSLTPRRRLARMVFLSIALSITSDSSLRPTVFSSTKSLSSKFFGNELWFGQKFQQFVRSWHALKNRSWTSVAMVKFLFQSKYW